MGGDEDIGEFSESVVQDVDEDLNDFIAECVYLWGRLASPPTLAKWQLQR